MDNITFSKMENSELNTCINVSSKAFANYEYFSVYFDELKERTKFIKESVKTEFILNKDKTTIFTAKLKDEIVAVAMLCPPEYKTPSLISYLKVGLSKDLLSCNIKNILSWISMQQKAIKPCHEIKKDAWYLNLLVVDPKYQSKGIGSKMLNDCIIPYVKNNNGTEISLFTNSENNKQFYLNDGFELFDEQIFKYKNRILGNWSLSIKL